MKYGSMMSTCTKRSSDRRMCSMFASEPVSRLSTQMTRCPRRRSSSHKWEPRKPAPPVTRQVGMAVKTTLSAVRLASRAMPATAFVERLNQQIAYEFGAHQQYVAVAVHYDAETLPRWAALFYAQPREERSPAMRMVQYPLDAGLDATLPGVQAPRTQFADIVEPVTLALEQERRVSDQIEDLAKVAREEGDYISEQFTLWFLKEQVEEVSTMSDLLRVVERARENPMFVEDYLAREQPGGEGADPTAPPAAGGPL